MTGLVYGEVHHVRFRSRGGGDEAENLMAVCPSCHRAFGHRLYSPQESYVLSNAAGQWRLLVQTGRRLRRARSWRAAAKVVLAPNVREAALLLGAYELVLGWTGLILADSSTADPEGALLRCRLILLSCNMSTYVGDPESVAVWLDEARAARAAVDMDRGDANTVALVEAKSLHLLGDVEGEEMALDAYVEPPGGDPEFGFRAISFALQADRQAPLRGWAPTTTAGDSLRDRMAIANIVGDQGRWLLREGRKEEAYRELARSFLMTRLFFHRRGMFVKAMLLADLALQMGEGQMAAEWWSIGDQFRLVGRNLALSPEPLREQIARMAGEAVLHAGAVSRTSFSRLVPVEVHREIEGALG